MKWLAHLGAQHDLASRPARGGWIEIASLRQLKPAAASRPARGGWIEMLTELVGIYVEVSRPARGGWIEMFSETKRHGKR